MSVESPEESRAYCPSEEIEEKEQRKMTAYAIQFLTCFGAIVFILVWLCYFIGREYEDYGDE